MLRGFKPSAAAQHKGVILSFSIAITYCHTVLSNGAEGHIVLETKWYMSACLACAVLASGVGRQLCGRGHLLLQPRDHRAGHCAAGLQRQGGLLELPLPGVPGAPRVYQHPGLARQPKRSIHVPWKVCSTQ